MKNKKMNLDSFSAEKISTNQQKMVRGGDDDPINPPTGDPIRTGTGGGNNG